MWFGSNGAGVFRWDGEVLRQFTTEHGLAGLQVRDIQEDPRGHVLVSTNSGISRWDGKGFATLEVVKAPHAWRLDPKDVWILHDPGNSGPCRYDGEKLYELTLPESPMSAAFYARNPGVSVSPEDLFEVYRDRRGNVWFGTFASGLCRYDGKSFGWMYEERLTTTPSGGGFGIRSIFEDRAGDFWICNTRQRFQVHPEVATQDGFPVLQYRTQPGVPGAQQDESDNFTYFHSMAQDDAGIYWMAAGSDGVWEYDGQTLKKHAIGEEAYTVSLRIDQAGKVWVGTLEQGAWVSVAGRFVPFAPQSAD